MIYIKLSISNSDTLFFDTYLHTYMVYRYNIESSSSPLPSYPPTPLLSYPRDIKQ